MAKGTRARGRTAARHCGPRPYKLRPIKGLDKRYQKKSSKMHEKKDWEDATCSVCMEYPHNAVLLLCSSHEKGCRPYMCGTSFRYSNCLDQYRKAYTKGTHDDQHNHDSVDSLSTNAPVDKFEITRLSCPLCRGLVKGWTVVRPAREYLNRKKRSCMQDDCSFVGTYKEVRRHVRAEHPTAKPREVDPVLEQKWRSLEGERERDDVISTITSSMPRAVVIGDYVIEGSPYGFASENDGSEDGISRNWTDLLLLLQRIGSAGNRRQDRQSSRTLEGHAVENTHDRSFEYFEDDREGNTEVDDDFHDMSLVNRLRRQGRVLLGRSGRRRRRRESGRGW